MYFFSATIAYQIAGRPVARLISITLIFLEFLDRRTNLQAITDSRGQIVTCIRQNHVARQQTGCNFLDCCDGWKVNAQAIAGATRAHTPA
jgi:hypothetical protein